MGADVKLTQVVLNLLENGPMTLDAMQSISGQNLKRAVCYLREKKKVCIHGHIALYPHGGRVTIYALGSFDKVDIKRRALKEMRKRRECWVNHWKPFRDPMLTAIFG